MRGWGVALDPALPAPVPLPCGFSAHVASVGIRDDTDDFVVILSDRPAVADGVFTRSRFVGPSVVLSRSHVSDHQLRAFVVIAKNANVANGPQGEADAREVADGVAQALRVAPEDVLLASTGVIGWRYPMDRIRAHLATLTPPFDGTDASDAAQGIMTTDTVPKMASATVVGSAARVVGIAKGVGMIEPDMATHISLFCTDAEVDAAALETMFRRVVDDTFNSLSIDTDTSTSDTSAVMANGAAGPVDLAAFEDALAEVALSLTRQIAADGEGATKLVTVTVDHARDQAQAKRVAKAVVNSPLVKTAVHGADPNWGRVVMAVGKCADDTDIDQERVRVRFGEQEVYPTPVGGEGLERLASYMTGHDVAIGVTLATGTARATVYGCDLSAEYVRLNGEYTT